MCVLNAFVSSERSSMMTGDDGGQQQAQSTTDTTRECACICGLMHLGRSLSLTTLSPWKTCERISCVVSCLMNPILPVAQKSHALLHPTWLDTHRVVRASTAPWADCLPMLGMTTDSTWRPSLRSMRSFVVESDDMDSSETDGKPRKLSERSSLALAVTPSSSKGLLPALSVSHTILALPLPPRSTPSSSRSWKKDRSFCPAAIGC